MTDPPPPFPGKIFSKKSSLPSPYPSPRIHSRAATPSPARHSPTVSPLHSSPPLPILLFPPASIFLTKAAHVRVLTFRPSPSYHSPPIPSLFAYLHFSLCAFVSPDPVRSFSTWCVYMFVPLLPFPSPPLLGVWGALTAQGLRNRALSVHERVNSRF